MAKKKNEYEIEQSVLDIDSEALESASERTLKATMDKLKDEYQAKRKERLETQKRFIEVYKSVGELRLSLYTKVKNGEITPDEAIEELKEIVANL